MSEPSPPVSRLQRLRVRLKPLLLNLTVASAALVIGLSIMELAIRLVLPQQLIFVRPDIWEPADGTGWRRRSHVDTRINTGERTVTLRTDSLGYRIGARGAIDADTKILLLGDSFMGALQVEYEQSLAGLMEERLASRLAKPVAVRNGGVDGWDPNQYRVLAEERLDESFDLLLVTVFVGNDVVGKRVDGYPRRSPVPVYPLRFPRGLSAKEFTDAVLRPANDVFERRSHLFVLLKNRLQMLRMRMGLTAEYLPPEFLRAEAANGRWEVTGAICAEIAAIGARHGVPVLFALIPAQYQVNPAVFQQYVRGLGIDTSAVDLMQPNRLLAQAFNARGLSFIDPLGRFQTATQEGRVLYGTVDRHLTPDGHELLFSELEPMIVEVLARPAAGPE